MGQSSKHTLASHAIAEAVFLPNPLDLPGLVNYLILQLLPEGWFKLIRNALLSPGRSRALSTVKGSPGFLDDKQTEAYLESVTSRTTSLQIHLSDKYLLCACPRPSAILKAVATK